MENTAGPATDETQNDEEGAVAEFLPQLLEDFVPDKSAQESGRQNQPKPSNVSLQQSQPKPTNVSQQQNQPKPSNVSQQQNQSKPANVSQQQNQSKPSNVSQQQNQPKPSNISQQQSQPKPSNISQQQNQPSNVNQSSQPAAITRPHQQQQHQYHQQHQQQQMGLQEHHFASRQDYINHLNRRQFILNQQQRYQQQQYQTQNQWQMQPQQLQQQGLPQQEHRAPLQSIQPNQILHRSTEGEKHAQTKPASAVNIAPGELGPRGRSDMEVIPANVARY